MRNSAAMGESSAIGWIAISEVFLVGSLVMLAAAAAINRQLGASQEDNQRITSVAEKSATALSSTRDALKKRDQELSVATTGKDDAVKRSTDLDKKLTDSEQRNKTLKTSRDETTRRLTDVRTTLGETQHKLTTADLNLKRSESDLATANETVKLVEGQLLASCGDLERTLRELRTRELEISREKADLLAKYEQSIAALGKDKLDLLSELAQANAMERQLRAIIEGHKSVPAELLELRGELTRVVFLYDRSASMKDRWKHTRQTFLTWMKHLPVDQCAVVAFGDDVSVYPPKGSTPDMLDMRDKDARQEHLKSLEEWLTNNIQPDGNYTDTGAAFETAYAYADVSMIVLFTDGQPNTKSTNNAARLSQYRNDLLATCRSKKIIVNTVALGNYFSKPEFTSFLMDVAKATKGTFIGK